MKILCLHAFGQNGQVFRKATGSFRKLFKGLNFEYIFVDAPHKIEDSPDQLAWYFVDKSDRSREPDLLDEGISHLRELVNTHKPDGMIGFSQGASVFSILCLTEPEFVSTVRFALLFGAPFSPRLRKSDNCHLRSEIPALIVSGHADAIIDCNQGKSLTEFFSNGKYVLHPGGHCVPSNNEIKSEYLNFLNPIVEQFLAEKEAAQS